jgi:diguanylate cyclase (GGDEF)-like protein
LKVKTPSLDSIARREADYESADRQTATRAGTVVWTVALLLLLLMLPLSPPHNAIGNAGWIVAGAIAAVGIGFCWWLTRPGTEIGVDAQLGVAYAAVTAFALMQWLAGGVEPPYEEAMVLPLLFVAAMHPLRRLIPFAVFVGCALAAPLLYDTWEHRADADSLVTFVIWCGLAVMTYVLMSSARRQRVNLIAEEAAAREEARVDTLTRLGNRRAYRETVAREVQRSRRSRQPLTIAMIDIVNFKGINDDWGHLEGDHCLQDVADALRSAARRPDLCFRWGGDEFALVLVETDAEGAEQLGDRLAETVSATCVRPEGEPVAVRVGVAELREDSDAQELLDSAGLALHAARARTEQEA